jgi:predicted phage terminase large subunit-like protein
MSLTAAEELELITLLESEERYQAANDYYSYVKYTHGSMYEYTVHGEFICNVLNEAVIERKKMKRNEIPMRIQYIMLSVPPQHGKSMHVTETFPSYFEGNFPNEGVIEISYNGDFAEKFGGKNKDKVKYYGKELFNIGLAKDSNSKSEWEITDTNGMKTRGGMISRGIMSGITGSSLGDCIIIDDPIKNREEANSETYREKVWTEWIDSISTRIHPGAIVIIIMTRWHEDDLCGRLLNPEYAKPLDWLKINLPLEAEENDILDREIGEPLWLDRYGYSFIEERKSYPSSFNSLYQGRPTSQEGNMLKRSWWKYYDVLPAIKRKLLSVDASFKDGDENDKVSIQVWGKAEADIYLIDRVNARMNFPTTLQSIRNVITKHPDAALKLVEDKANGSAIIAMLQREIGGIVAVNPEGGKIARVNAVSPHIEAGNVWLPRNAEWVHDFVEECASFPNGKNDDDVDAMSQALNRFIYFGAKMPKEEEELTPADRWMKEMNEKHLKKAKLATRRR